jgi:hypothetical protein
VTVFRAGEGYNLFDALAPAVDQEFEQGAVATYSLDLVALIGLTVALTGSSDPLRKLSPVEVIRALDSLKGRLTVLCQRGRIAVPRGAPSIIAQLERFIIEQHHDERKGSWHPKAALAAYRRKGGDARDREWRLWIGSSNLSGSRDLEAGLLLIGTATDERANAPKGMREFLEFLLKPLWRQGSQRSRFASEVAERVGWRTPAGVEVESLHFWPGHAKGGKPQADFGALRARDAVLLSPFANPTGLKILAEGLAAPTGKEVRILVTTREQLQQPQLREIALGSGFELKTFDAPAIDVGAEGLEQQQAALAKTPGIDGEPTAEEPGLHAKLYLFRRRGKDKPTLLVGSANATGRGLTGRNSEVLAQLRVSDSVADSLLEFAQNCDDWQEEPEEPEDTATRELLANLQQDRNTIAAMFRPQLMIEPDGTVTLLGQLPVLITDRAVFRAALLTRLEFPVPWPPSATGIELARELPRADWTDQIAFELIAPGDETLRTSWVQRVASPALDEATRQKCANAAVVQYLTPDELLQLASAEMSGTPISPTRGWTEPPAPPDRAHRSRRIDGPVSLEDILTARLREPAKFSAEAGRRMLERIVAARERMETATPEEFRTHALAFETLEQVWNILVEE